MAQNAIKRCPGTIRHVQAAVTAANHKQVMIMQVAKILQAINMPPSQKYGAYYNTRIHSCEHPTRCKMCTIESRVPM